MNKSPVLLALSLAIMLNNAALSEPGGLNTTNTGQKVNGGVYYNTAGSRTTFVNPGGSLHLQKGHLVRGLESSVGKVPTGNGGTLYFRAPDNAIRIDGDIDVSAVKNGSLHLGNGGKVFLDAAYLFQSGNIFANGYNGGLVQMNVGAATISPNAKITAQGIGGNGGSINIHATDVVNIRNKALLDSSGKVSGTYDTNVVNIEGAVVNNHGILRANGTSRDLRSAKGDAVIIAANPHLLNNPTPEPISPGDGTGQILFGPPLEFIPSSAASWRGGTVRLVATGKDNIKSGDIINHGRIQANGAVGQNGGTILLAATDDIVNRGEMTANGKNGGTVSWNALGHITARGMTSANGTSTGRGGLLGFSYNQMSLGGGNILANGKHGGLIAFSGNHNPIGLSLVQANGQTGGHGGTILLPQPTLLNTLLLKIAALGGKPASVWATHKNEVLVHGENALLLSRGAGNGNVSDTFSGRLSDAIVRSVEHPTGWSADALGAIKHKTNIVVSSTNSNPLLFDLPNANTNPIFSRPNALMVLNNGDITNNMHWSPGINLVGSGSHDTVFSLGGGHLSMLSSGNVTNNGFLLTRGLWSGGGINLAAGGDIVNNHVILNTTFNKLLASAFAPNAGYIASHSGSTTLKANGNITNNYRLNSNLAFTDIHPPLNNPQLIWPLFLNDAQIGASNYLAAGKNILNNQGANLSADALTYRANQLGLDNPTKAIGGIMTLKAGGTLINNGVITANGNAYQGFMDDRPINGSRFTPGTQFSDLKKVDSANGNIIIK